jgi:hypothetical protein
VSPSETSRTAADDKQNDDEKLEKTVVGGAVALALIVGLGMAAHKVGMLDGLFSSDRPLKVAAPILEVIKAQAKKGEPKKVLLSGAVGDDKSKAAIETDVKRVFPGIEVKNTIRVDARAVEKKRELVRISFAADAPNETWPRPRFGDVKRMELLWKEDTVTVRGSVFTADANAAFESAFKRLPEKARGAIQLRTVIRSSVPAGVLQTQLVEKLANRSFVFSATCDGAPYNLDEPSLCEPGAVPTLTDAPENAAIVADIAPLLKDLKGLEILVSAGAFERGLSMKQAEAVVDALIAGGAEGAGLRPASALRNNKLSLIVREKE